MVRMKACEKKAGPSTQQQNSLQHNASIFCLFQQLTGGGYHFFCVCPGPNLLAALQPLLIAVCTNPGRYPDPELRTAASLALAKFMTVR